MTYRFLLLSAILASLCIIAPSASHAQLPAELQQCLKSVSDFTGNCENYINKSVIYCLSQDIPYQRDTWSCQDQNNDRSIDANDIKVCSQSFSNTVCNNLEGITGIGGFGWRNCRDQCKLPSNGYIYKIQDVFKDKAYAKYNVTPPVDTTDNVDTCLKGADTTRRCSLIIADLITCYQSTPANHPLWSCTKADGTEASQSECKTLFIQRIERKLNNVQEAQCRDLGTSLNASPIGARFDEVYKMRQDKVVTPTPAVILPTPTSVIPNNADKAGEILNCGFANADTNGKQKCCAPGIGAQEFNMASDVPEDCSWWDAGCHLSTRLQSYFTLKTQGMIDQKTSEYNELLSKNGGVMPECFVGTCEIVAGERKCVPEKASAICERYIDDENYDAYSKCDTCMKQNLDFGKSNKFYSAIGCIDTSFEGIIGQVFTLGIGAAGMIALGCIIYSAFIMQTSMGNPEQLQKAQENVTSCITGLILIILSIFILRVLGVDILRIPGFGG